MLIYIGLNIYRKSYEHECNSWYMGTSDVFKVLKIARARGRVQFENFKNITSDHISRNERVIIRFFVYSILNKIIKESIFATYFSVKHL